MKLSDGMRIKQWMDTDKASYIKEVVAIWAHEVALLEAVVEAAQAFRDAEKWIDIDTDEYYLLVIALAALERRNA